MNQKLLVFILLATAVNCCVPTGYIASMADDSENFGTRKTRGPFDPSYSFNEDDYRYFGDL